MRDKICDKKKKRIFGWIAAAVWILLWQLVSMAGDNFILFAGPVETASALFGNLAEPAFYTRVACSVLRVYAGIFLGITAGVLCALCSFRFPLFEGLLRPVLSLVRAVPVASFAVVLIILWGASFMSAAVCFLVIWPYIYGCVLEGLVSTDEKLLEMARALKFPAWNRDMYIYRPAVHPFWEGAVSTAVGMAWKSGVAAEIIGLAGNSIGEGMYLAKISLNTAEVFSWTAVTVFLSFVTEKLIKKLGEIFFAWEPECRKRHQEKRDAGTGTVIRVKNAEKSFRQIRAVECWDAVFEKGRIYEFRTPSGSGKTTRLKLLAGLLKPEKGYVDSGRVTMLFQEDRLCEDYSAVKNAAMTGIGEKKARELLGQLLPEEVLDLPCRELSGGMKRRAALVRTMAVDSDFCLLDEPLNGLDRENREKVREYIRRMQNGRGIIAAMHDESL